MKKKDIVEGIIKRMDFPNVGIMDVDYKEVRIKNALLGQKVRARIQKVRNKRYEAALVEVLEESLLQKKGDICPHFGSCGGCLYGGFSYDKELEIKAGQIRRLMIPVLGAETFDSVYKGVNGSPKEWEYRNKMEFSFGDEYKGGPLALGMHKRGAFYDIVSVRSCKLIDSDFRSILSETLEFFSKRGIPYYNKNTHEGLLRHLLVRKAVHTGEILLSLVTASGMDDEMLNDYRDKLLSIKLEGGFAGILHTQNDRVADVVADEGTSILYGRDFFTEKLLGLSFKISPFSFFQTNSKGAERLYEIVGSLCKKSGTVYDLYSGTGTIGQIISPKAHRVIGVEIVEEAVQAANENTKQNQIKNATFIADDVLHALDTLDERPDTIILDPPREGVHPKALPKILAYEVPSIIYVSCKATSLVRDMQSFLEAGYKPVHIELVDMFPKTGNIETIVSFSRD